jgi:acetyltransferase-like isoleucine patch superfamily enzyme
MQRHFNNLFSVFFSFFKFFLIKVFKGHRFKFSIIERFSPNTHVNFLGKNSSIILGKKVRAHTGVRLKAIGKGSIIIGSNTSINYGCLFFAMEEIKIGDGVEFGPNVLIYDHDHDFRGIGGLKAKKYVCERVEIGANCWIGANCIILKGTILGDNCVVGAGSVIKGNFKDDSLIYQKRTTTVINN